MGEKTVMVKMRMPHSLADQMRELAKLNKTSLSYEMRQACADRLANEYGRMTYAGMDVTEHPDQQKYTFADA